VEKKIKATRIYASQDGNAHFADFELDFGTDASGAVTPPIDVDRLVFRHFPAHHEVGYHTAPRIQWVEIECADGCRRFFAGDLLLAEDLLGRGHITRGLDEPWVLAFCPVRQ
jgi:hypothetical protein